MKEITQFESFQLEIWRRPRQRRMHLTVRADGRLRVTCNRRVPKREIFKFVDESRGFIARRVLEIEELRLKHPPKRYLSGETLLYLGDERPVDVIWTWRARIEVRTEANAFEILAPLTSTSQDRAAAVADFFRREGRRHLLERVAHWSTVTGLQPQSVSVRGQTTRWGSCTSRGAINLNWKLMALPQAVIDYVVVHELAHLQHMNHSSRFWGLVERFIPEHRMVRARLKEFETAVSMQFPKPN